MTKIFSLTGQYSTISSGFTHIWKVVTCVFTCGLVIGFLVLIRCLKSCITCLLASMPLPVPSMTDLLTEILWSEECEGGHRKPQPQLCSEVYESIHLTVYREGSHFHLIGSSCFSLVYFWENLTGLYWVHSPKCNWNWDSYHMSLKTLSHATLQKTYK